MMMTWEMMLIKMKMKMGKGDECHRCIIIPVLLKYLIIPVTGMVHS